MADQKLFDSLISAQSAIDSTNLRKRIRVRGRVRVRVRLWERLRGRRAFASNADFATRVGVEPNTERHRRKSRRSRQRTGVRDSKHPVFHGQIKVPQRYKTTFIQNVCQSRILPGLSLTPLGLV